MGPVCLVCEGRIEDPVRTSSLAASLLGWSVQVNYYSSTDVFGEQDINVDGTELVLTDLAKFHQYVVRVVAYNNNGPGPATEELTCRTFSDGKSIVSDTVCCY